MTDERYIGSQSRAGNPSNTTARKTGVFSELARCNDRLGYLHQTIEELNTAFVEAQTRYAGVIGASRPTEPSAKPTAPADEVPPSTDMGNHIRSISGSIEDAVSHLRSMTAQVRDLTERCELP